MKKPTIKTVTRPPGRAKNHDEGGNLYRLLIDRVQDYAIFALDEDGYILTWNAGAERLKGYKPGEIIGRHFSVFYPPEDVAADKPAHELELAIATGSAEDDGWRVRKDGTRFWANVLITALRDDTGKLRGFAKVTRDLTERRAALADALDSARRAAAEEVGRVAAESQARELWELAQRLGDQAAELERRSVEADDANRAKSEFLAAMSHELRTPLNAIGGYAQLMEMGIAGPVSDQQRVHLERIQRSQQHLLGIINDILNFSRIEAGHLAYDIGPVVLQEVLEVAAAMFVPQAGEKRIRVKMAQCPPDLIASADRAKVEQILLNLLSNAVKFTPDDGEIKLTCGAQSDHVSLAVRDTGIGIPVEQIELIFAPFMQVGRSLASPKEGAGLGLAISRDLARGMRGELTVESREGSGSTFTLTLPRVPARSPKA